MLELYGSLSPAPKLLLNPSFNFLAVLQPWRIATSLTSCRRVQTVTLSAQKAASPLSWAA